MSFGYDLANRMTSTELVVTGANAQPKVTLGYDDAGRLTSLSRTDLYGGSGGGGGGAVPVDTAFSYDAASRVTGITHTADLTTLADYSFTWDAAGQLTQEVSNDGTANFTYDITAQLTGVTGWRSESYTFDDLGNRTLSGYQTGTGNRLLSDGNFNYTYDNEGNLLTKTEIATSQVTEYTWDYRNRLTNVTVKNSGGSVIQESNYTYDPLDKRIGVSVDPDGDGPQVAEETWTVYDGVNPYADFDASGSLTSRYLYGPAVDMILARLDSSDQIGWYLTDHLGSVRDIADTTGAVIDHIQYDSFGNVLSETNPTAGDRFKFTGREYDEATGQYYYRARYYDAAVGRFLSEDPIGFAGGDPNLARYVGNSPTNATDPAGLQQGAGGFASPDDIQPLPDFEGFPWPFDRPDVPYDIQFELWPQLGGRLTPDRVSVNLPLVTMTLNDPADVAFSDLWDEFRRQIGSRINWAGTDVREHEAFYHQPLEPADLTDPALAALREVYDIQFEFHPNAPLLEWLSAGAGAGVAVFAYDTWLKDVFPNVHVSLPRMPLYHSEYAKIEVRGITGHTGDHRYYIGAQIDVEVRDFLRFHVGGRVSEDASTFLELTVEPVGPIQR